MHDTRFPDAGFFTQNRLMLRRPNTGHVWLSRFALWRAIHRVLLPQCRRSLCHSCLLACNILHFLFHFLLFSLGHFALVLFFLFLHFLQLCHLLEENAFRRVGSRYVKFGDEQGKNNTSCGAKSFRSWYRCSITYWKLYMCYWVTQYSACQIWTWGSDRYWATLASQSGVVEKRRK